MTIYDIAEKFNVNISTVSKALRGSSDIAESTRKAICEYAEANGYKPRRARAKKGEIAVLRYRERTDDPCLEEIAEIFRRDAEEDNYTVSVHLIENGFDPDIFLAEKPYAGIFILGMGLDALLIRKLKTIGVPSVVLGSQVCDNPLVSNVKSDDLVAASNAVDHLVSLGHNLIAYIGTEDDSLVGAERFAGYFFGLSKNAVPYRYDLTYFGDATERTGRDAAEYFLSYNKYFTAVVCAFEETAIGFVDYMKRAGKEIPGDISVVCFGTSRSADRNLTVNVPDPTALGRQSFAAMKSTIEGLPAQHATVPHVFVNPEGSCAEKKKRFSADAE